MSEGESGLGRPFPSPGSWLRAQAGLISFAYICIYASFTCAPWQGPEKDTCAGAPEGNQSGWLPAGVSKPRILVHGPSAHQIPESLNQTHSFLLWLLWLLRPGTSESFLPLPFSGIVTKPSRVCLFSRFPSFPLPPPPIHWALPPHFTLDLFATAS